MKTITFYSYKGGVGRTLTLANIAKRLSEFQKKVCIIDFDLEAPGIHHKFKNNINIESLKNGIVDYIEFYSKNKKLPEYLQDYITPISFKSKNFKDIDLIAAGSVFNEKYWHTLFNIDWNSLFYKKDSYGVALFVDLKERIRKELKPDYLLIDSRTGISEISGISLSIFADEIVLFAANNDENIWGIKQVLKSLSKPENTLVGKLPKINFVLCRIPFFNNPDKKYLTQTPINIFERSIKKFIEENNIKIKYQNTIVLHSDSSLELEEKLLMGYEFENECAESRSNKSINNQPIAKDYLNLFEELTKDQLTPKEKVFFNKLKKAEFNIETSLKISDISKKIELLKEAIELNPKSDEAHIILAKIYCIKKLYDKALEHTEIAIKINNSSNEYLYLKGAILYELGKIEIAIGLLKKVLKSNESFYGALLLLGNIYLERKDFKTALSFYNKIIEFYPDFYGGYNCVGNLYRKIKDYESAFKYTYRALELNPKDPFSNATLAEIYAEKGNTNEFFKNFELALSFGLQKEDLEKILIKEETYKIFFNNPNFIKLLIKHNINIDLSKY